MFDVNVWVIIWKEILSVYHFKFWCFDKIPYDCFVEWYLRGVAEGTKSRKIDNFALSKKIPRRLAVIWSEQINHYGSQHTMTEVGERSCLVKVVTMVL